jgi:hypothetical protein
MRILREYQDREYLRAVLGLGKRWHLWEAHHKVAVVQGGGLCGLEGYETLCFRCHNEETRKLRKALADARRESADAAPLFVRPQETPLVRP